MGSALNGESDCAFSPSAPPASHTHSLSLRKKKKKRKSTLLSFEGRWLMVTVNKNYLKLINKKKRWAAYSQ